MSRAIVLIAHGSRRAEANRELERLAAAVQAHRRDCEVAAAFLELAEPTIPAAVAACIARGARHVQLFPYFLSPGVHVARDLEAYREQFAREHPGVKIRLARPLGAHPGIVPLVLDLLAEAEAPTGIADGGTAGPDRQSE